VLYQVLKKKEEEERKAGVRPVKKIGMFFGNCYFNPCLSSLLAFCEFFSTVLFSILPALQHATPLLEQLCVSFTFLRCLILILPIGNLTPFHYI